MSCLYDNGDGEAVRHRNGICNFERSFEEVVLIKFVSAEQQATRIGN